jgi:hypothetical protein
MLQGRSGLRLNGVGWRNTKHASQWETTLQTYAYPFFGNEPISLLDTSMVQKALEPIWVNKNVTASRVRSRIESVFDWSTAKGYRTGDNPARWKGNLDRGPSGIRLLKSSERASYCY